GRFQSGFPHPNDHVVQLLLCRALGGQPRLSVRVAANSRRGDVHEALPLSDKLLITWKHKPSKRGSKFEGSVCKVLKHRRDGRVAEGARLESVFTRKGNVGSNPTLSASSKALTGFETHLKP